MHASINQLLSLRDREPVAADVRQHVDSCEQCQGELQRLQTVRNLLQQLPQLETSQQQQNDFAQLDQRWQHVQQQVHRRQHRRQRVGIFAVAACVAVIVIAAIPTLLTRTATEYQSESPPVASLTTAVPPFSATQTKHAQWLARNVQLENALRDLPQAPKVTRGGTAYAIASFEDQIALVDYQLSYGEAVGMNESQSVSLLQNRAELLDSLYKVRYTQALASLANY